LPGAPSRPSPGLQPARRRASVCRSSGRPASAKHTSATAARRSPVNRKDILPGNTPFITAKADNNGVSGFIGNKSLFLKGTITIEKITLSAFYQSADYYCSHDVSVIQNDKLTKEIALFICAMVKRQGIKYSYGRQAQMNVVKKETVLLPTECSDTPDYEYMGQYISEIEQTKKQKYINYVQTKINELKYIDIPALDEKEWGEFCIDDIFIISAGKRLEKHNMTAGETPFIGATDSGNGITNYVSNKNESLDKNVLGVNYNGNGVAIAFYHPYECLFTDDVKRFHLKNGNDNAYVFLFLKTIIVQQKSKYNYGYKFNEKRMKRQYLLLPVDDEGNPD